MSVSRHVVGHYINCISTAICGCDFTLLTAVKFIQFIVCVLYDVLSPFRACASAQVCVLFVGARAECRKCVFVCFHGARLNFQIVTRHLSTRLTFQPSGVCECIRTFPDLCFSHSASVSA